jgi:hypothetical protein
MVATCNRETQDEAELKALPVYQITIATIRYMVLLTSTELCSVITVPVHFLDTAESHPRDGFQPPLALDTA